MNGQKLQRVAYFQKQLTSYHRHQRMHGLSQRGAARSLACQFVESERRIEFVRVLSRADISSRRTDPGDTLFDPLRAAIWHVNNGDRDEAFWLLFIFTHFGPHAKHGYSWPAAVYGGMAKQTWTWAAISRRPASFVGWLKAAQSAVKAIPGGFGNHRKYVSLDAHKRDGTGAAFSSYVDWVMPHGSHDALISDAANKQSGDPQLMFRHLYRTMAVRSFGRVAKFDFLTMLGKTGLAPIEPGSPYLTGATGPLSGTRLLFDGDCDSGSTASQIEPKLIALGAHLGVGMQVLEDAVCNWQKSPTIFVGFRG